MRKLFLFISLLFASSTPIFAQDLGLESGAESIWDQIKGAAVYILAAIFLVSLIINIGKAFGENRDYAALVRGMLIWIGILLAASAIITWILSLSF